MSIRNLTIGAAMLAASAGLMTLGGTAPAQAYCKWPCGIMPYVEWPCTSEDPAWCENLELLERHVPTANPTRAKKVQAGRFPHIPAHVGVGSRAHGMRTGGMRR